MSTQKLWTVEEANAFIPGLSRLVGQQMARAGEVERLWKRLQQAKMQRGNRPQAAESPLSSAPSHHDLSTLENDLQARILAYEEGWREIEALGVSVKDPRIGLCDFYGRVDGKLVWLCWRYGEQAIDYYHDLDAGFAARKPLTGATRQRLLN